MESRRHRPPPRRRTGLAIERLEPREMPTVPTLLTGPIGIAGGSSSRTTSTIAASLSPMPTRHERVREAFVAKFVGSYLTGPGRFTDQRSQIFIQGGGTASAFLHGDLQMAVYSPRDPSSPATGTAALIVKNVTNSGNLLVLDVQSDPGSVDRAGRPTRLTWTVNEASGGTFGDATGQGTVEIRYWSSGGKLARRATGGGTAGVIFRGSINTDGVQNLLRPIS